VVVVSFAKPHLLVAANAINSTQQLPRCSASFFVLYFWKGNQTGTAAQYGICSGAVGHWMTDVIALAATSRAALRIGRFEICCGQAG
jgi:hypothetical protein